jgi:signal transduction histidine kinase
VRLALPKPTRGWSLTARLAWRLALVTVSAILLAAGAVAWRSFAALHDLDDTALQQQVGFLIEHLPPPAPAAAADRPLILPRAITDRFKSSDGDTVFLIFSHDGTLIACSDPEQSQALLALLPKPLPQGFIRLAATPNHPTGMMGFAHADAGRMVLVVQAQDRAEAIIDGLTTHFMAAAIWLLLPIGLLMLVVSIVTLRRGLRPLVRASAAAAAIRPGEPGRRLPDEGLPREVTPLVDAVNEALSRLERTIDAQRSFMAQAAHGLRTPLAVLTARLDGLPDSPEIRGLRLDTDRMTRLVSQLLRMARLESLPMDLTEPVDLHSVAAEAVAALAPLAIREAVALELTGVPSLPISGNRAALVLALTNLIENAIGYAPRGTSVEIRLLDSPEIQVFDRGPGIPPDQQETLLRPFERGPNAREGGAGLGLAIAQQIAQAHGGSLSLVSRAGGGTCARLALQR